VFVDFFHQLREAKVPVTKEGFEVGPRRGGTLGCDVVRPVEDVVEDLQPEVGLGDLVDVGKREGDADGRSGDVFVDAPPLVSQVSPGFFDEGEEAFVLRPVGAPHGPREV